MGEDEKLSNSPFPSATAEPRSFQDNIDDVARLLEVSENAPGMPSEANPAGELTVDLAPGDYEIKAACAGLLTAKLTLVKGGGPPETLLYPCEATAMKRFERHAGGPIMIRAEPLTGNTAVAGVTVAPNHPVGPNHDLQASRSRDLLEWSVQQLKPELPGELSWSGESSTATGYRSGPLAASGKYELHLVCQGPSESELSVSDLAGAEVLAPVLVTCDGRVFKATVHLATEGADITMNPAAGPDFRYAFRLVPST
ncbi:hypothetical protein [Arthrobacter oryzae]|uniref:hypothetical protein n=1 Tax=Arthrobacter oryzae TaxID=409290 RepID=UPI002862F3B5|nr:hypothetical protein [Arthrobacter oryzae]MDR6508594.1 hypothetical protein [Arthrobacter oryzae]